MRDLFLRLRALILRNQVERELDEELSFHVEMQTRKNLALGMDPQQARRRARVQFGANTGAVKEYCRDVRSILWLEQLWQDLRYASRRLRQTPGFTATALAALALGIGATTAIFSLVDAVLLKPAPVPNPERFVALVTRTMNQNGEEQFAGAGSPVKYTFFKAQTSVLEDVSALGGGLMNYAGGDVVEQLPYWQVSADLFKAFGFPILRGRGFTQAEDSPGGPHVALISQGWWTTRFASDPGIVGRAISLNGEPYTIIGVAAFNSGWLEEGPAPAVFVPFQLDLNTTDIGNHGLQVFARLKSGVTLKQANAELDVAVGGFKAKFPASIRPKDSLQVMPSKEYLIGNTRPLLRILLGSVALVLLIACANVANLLLVRATGRRREIAIRSAIGAWRGRVIRQLLTESLLLSLAGGVLGSMLGLAGMRALLAVNTAGLDRVGENGSAVGIDWRVMAFTLGISLLTGIIFGVFPALQGSRVDLNSDLKDSGARSGTGLKQNKTRAVLVVSEVGLAVVLLVGSALLIRTFLAMYAVHPGFETRNVLTLRTLMAAPQYQTTAGVADATRDGLERIRTLPGVVQAAAAYYVPLEGGAAVPFNIFGRASAPGGFTGAAAWSPVSPGFFELLKIPVKRGRAFNARDDNKSPPVVIIDERLAELYWKDSDPLKDQIVIGRGITRDFDAEPARQIIGIVGGVRSGVLNRGPVQTMYVPQSQLPDAATAFALRQRPMAWIVRTRDEPRALVPAVREQLRQITGLPVSDVRSMDQVVSLSTARQRFNMLLMTVFGCAALLLAAIGIYGLMAYSAEQRTQEIGIRLALGAEASQLRNMIVRQGMGLALAGVFIGIGAAWWLSRVIASLLFGVNARDPLVFVAVPAALSVVALLAVWLPASRASRIDPMEALRYE